MKMQFLNYLTKHNIDFSLGQVKGGYESIEIPYKQRAEFIEYLRKHRVKMRIVDYSDDMTKVKLIFEKENSFFI